MFSLCFHRKGLLKVTIVRDRLRVLSVWLFVKFFWQLWENIYSGFCRRLIAKLESRCSLMEEEVDS